MFNTSFQFPVLFISPKWGGKQQKQPPETKNKKASSM